MVGIGPHNVDAPCVLRPFTAASLPHASCLFQAVIPSLRNASRPMKPAEWPAAWRG
ncbi:MAG: hypothetical protein J6Y34_01475 [Bacteroidales bacterium]|nr:hypothetical protein [Bacteroidales bacterium]